MSLNFYYKNNIQSQNLNGSLLKKQKKNFKKILLEIKNDIKNEKKTLNVLNKNFKFNFKTKDLNKFKKFKSIAIVGMGGSILGAEAIYNLFQKKIKKKIHFFNNLDEDEMINFKKKEKPSKILFIIISKSGSTIETLSNIFALNIIKKNSKNVILISEKKNNSLYSLSKNYNLFYIEHNEHIGGRYSVFSEVGIIPAFLMGVNIFKLRSKILDYLKNSNESFLKDNVLKISNLMSSKKFNSLILLNYCPKLEKFLYWCQQLLAESLGKKNKGLLPLVSNAPKDHHSLLQLYLDGPKDKYFNIFSLEEKFNIKVNIYNKDIKTFLNKKKISTIKNAQKNALVKTLIKKNIPFREFRLKKINEENIGKLFSMFIIETIIIGKLMKVDPFNQPAVEQVKTYTKTILS